VFVVKASFISFSRGFEWHIIELWRLSYTSLRG